MIYAITGATGNIGSKLAAQLLAAGHAVRVIGRDAKRLAPLVSQGAKAYVGKLSDKGFLTEAFTGTDAVFAMLPPQHDAADLHAAQVPNRDALVAALKDAQVSHVVALSSVGANHPSGTGVVETLYHFEQALAGLGETHIKILRPSFFMENLFGQLPVIRAAGIVATSVQPDKAVPMIATQDIAAAAAEFLLARNFSGHSVQFLLGSRDYTYPQVAELLGKALNKPQLPYVQLSYADEIAGLTQAGLSPSVAEGLSNLNRSVNEGKLLQSVTRTPENSTPTTLADFLPELAKAYR